MRLYYITVYLLALFDDAPDLMIFDSLRGNGLLAYNTCAFLGLHFTFCDFPAAYQEERLGDSLRARSKNELIDIYTKYSGTQEHNLRYDIKHYLDAKPVPHYRKRIFTDPWLQDVREYLRMWLLFGTKFESAQLTTGCKFPTDGQNAATMIPFEGAYLTTERDLHKTNQILTEFAKINGPLD